MWSCLCKMHTFFSRVRPCVDPNLDRKPAPHTHTRIVRLGKVWESSDRACCPICPTLATETQASGPGPTLGVRRPVRCAASLSIGACRLLPQAHGAGDSSARGQLKGLQGRLSRQDRQNSAERARSQAELGLRWTTIKATIRICELCRGTRALYPPRSMPVRTHKTVAQLATTGTQDQSQDALPWTMTSPQLSDFVRFHDF